MFNAFILPDVETVEKSGEHLNEAASNASHVDVSLALLIWSNKNTFIVDLTTHTFNGSNFIFRQS